ncbi:MAG TPA: hypothetical protein VF395_11935 [Polyangiaceae bacterium]
MRTCIQCDKKIGFLKKPVDGGYCSTACRDAALEESLLRERERALFQEEELIRLEAEERAVERERLEIEAARLRGTSDVVLRPDLTREPCPKCGQNWKQIHGGGRFGKYRGECSSCGFEAEFVAIEQCANCRCHSLIVESQDDARCPRCKSRPRRRRQIA